MSSLYYQSFNEWSKGGDYSMGSSLKQIKEFASLMQSTSNAIKRVDVKLDKDPNAAANAKAHALLTINIEKRGQHIFAEQFNYFQDPNEFKIGY